MKDLTVRRAVTAGDKEALYRFRYEVYVKELGRYSSAADHERRRFEEPEDDHSWNFVALLDGEIVAASRLTWGGDGFSRRQIEHFRLAPFLADMPAGWLAVGERAMVSPAHRGTGVLDRLIEATAHIPIDLGIRAIFGACEPHLLSLYLERGQRTYADRNINSEEAGYLVPLVTFIGDCTIEGIVGTGRIRHPAVSDPARYQEEAGVGLAVSHAFKGFDATELDQCLRHSAIIEGDAGDRILKQGNAARNAFVVLDGTLEVRDGDRVVGTLAAGDIFGERAFFMRRARQYDVCATTSVRLLSLSEGTLRRVIADDPVITSKLASNVARVLVSRSGREIQRVRSHRPGRVPIPSGR